MKKLQKLLKAPACNLDGRKTQLYQPLQQDDIQFFKNFITATHRHQIGKLLVLLTALWVRDCRTTKLPTQESKSKGKGKGKVGERRI